MVARFAKPENHRADSPHPRSESSRRFCALQLSHGFFKRTDRRVAVAAVETPLREVTRFALPFLQRLHHMRCAGKQHRGQRIGLVAATRTDKLGFRAKLGFSNHVFSGHSGFSKNRS